VRFIFSLGPGEPLYNKIGATSKRRRGTLGGLDQRGNSAPKLGKDEIRQDACKDKKKVIDSKSWREYVRARLVLV